MGGHMCVCLFVYVCVCVLKHLAPQCSCAVKTHLWSSGEDFERSSWFCCWGKFMTHGLWSEPLSLSLSLVLICLHWLQPMGHACVCLSCNWSPGSRSQRRQRLDEVKWKHLQQQQQLKSSVRLQDETSQEWKTAAVCVMKEKRQWNHSELWLNWGGAVWSRGQKKRPGREQGDESNARSSEGLVFPASQTCSFSKEAVCEAGQEEQWWLRAVSTEIFTSSGWRLKLSSLVFEWSFRGEEKMYVWRCHAVNTGKTVRLTCLIYWVKVKRINKKDSKTKHLKKLYIFLKISY